MPAPILPHPSSTVYQGSIGNIGQALWNVLKAIGGAPKGSGAADFTNSIRSLGLNKPMNVAAILAGGGDLEGSPLEGQSWLEPYSLQKSIPSGQVTFREGQPYSTKGQISALKTNRALNGPGYGRTPTQVANSNEVIKLALQHLHDSLFGGQVWTAPGQPPIPGRP